jgi:hydrogenase maturation factor
MYVYVLPAQVEQGVYPLGGDVRYLVSQDDSRIVEKRQFHKSIIEFAIPPETQKAEAGYHTAVLDDVPEDTDVFHVLVRKSSVPEWVATRQYVYRIETDGVINYLKTREAFMKTKDK